MEASLNGQVMHITVSLLPAFFESLTTAINENNPGFDWGGLVKFSNQLKL